MSDSGPNTESGSDGLESRPGRTKDTVEAKHSEHTQKLAEGKRKKAAEAKPGERADLLNEAKKLLRMTQVLRKHVGLDQAHDLEKQEQESIADKAGKKALERNEEKADLPGHEHPKRTDSVKKDATENEAHIVPGGSYRQQYGYDVTGKADQTSEKIPDKHTAPHAGTYQKRDTRRENHDRDKNSNTDISASISDRLESTKTVFASVLTEGTKLANSVHTGDRELKEATVDGKEITEMKNELAREAALIFRTEAEKEIEEIGRLRKEVLGDLDTRSASAELEHQPDASQKDGSPQDKTSRGIWIDVLIDRSLVNNTDVEREFTLRVFEQICKHYQIKTGRIELAQIHDHYSRWKHVVDGDPIDSEQLNIMISKALKEGDKSIPYAAYDAATLVKSIIDIRQQRVEAYREFSDRLKSTPYDGLAELYDYFIAGPVNGLIDMVNGLADTAVSIPNQVVTIFGTERLESPSIERLEYLSDWGKHGAGDAAAMGTQLGITLISGGAGAGAGASSKASSFLTVFTGDSAFVTKMIGYAQKYHKINATVQSSQDTIQTAKDIHTLVDSNAAPEAKAKAADRLSRTLANAAANRTGKAIQGGSVLPHSTETGTAKVADSTLETAAKPASSLPEASSPAKSATPPSGEISSSSASIDTPSPGRLIVDRRPSRRAVGDVRRTDRAATKVDDVAGAAEDLARVPRRLQETAAAGKGAVDASAAPVKAGHEIKQVAPEGSETGKSTSVTTKAGEQTALHRRKGAPITITGVGAEAVPTGDQPIKHALQPDSPVAKARQAMSAETGWIKQQGAGTEGAALSSAHRRGENAVDLNDYERYQKARNFPVVDNASDRTFQSVKAKRVQSPLRAQSGEISLLGHDLRAYRRDFQALLDKTKTAQAAKAIDGIRGKLQDAKAWPKGLKPDAKQSEIAEFLRRESELAVPDDHVDAVRQSIGADAARLPQNYGLDRNSPTFAVDIARLQERVVPAGVTARQLKAMQDEIRRPR